MATSSKSFLLPIPEAGPYPLYGPASPIRRLFVDVPRSRGGGSDDQLGRIGSVRFGNRLMIDKIEQFFRDVVPHQSRLLAYGGQSQFLRVGSVIETGDRDVAVGMGCILINVLKVDCNESSPSGITRTSSLIWACAQASLNPLMR